MSWHITPEFSKIRDTSAWSPLGTQLDSLLNFLGSVRLEEAKRDNLGILFQFSIK